MTDAPVAEAAPEAPIVTGPTSWAADGLQMEVPVGWSGHGGLPGGTLILQLQHDTGVGLEIWSFPRSGTLLPRPREGCEPVFADAGTYRSVPGLGVQLVATCVPDTADGNVVEGWYAIVGDREVHVEALLPVGQVIPGEATIAPLLESLRIDRADAGTPSADADRR
jgi:hypothetical protein